MKRKTFLRVSFVLSVLSLCLPWFTYNARVMGYRYGIAFVKWYAVPFVFIGIHLFSEKISEVTALLAEVSVTANLVVSVWLFGRWQEICNIAAGFQWTDGFRTAQAGFWIAAGLMLILFFAFQVEFCRLRIGDSGTE